jgi:predicted transposase/invertase (TIGR01784 family)
MSKRTKTQSGNALSHKISPAEPPTKKSLLLPRYDRIFKKLFGSKKNIRILRSLLSAVLDLPPESLKTITIEDPNLRMENKDANKEPVLDLKLTLADGTNLDVELQVGSVTSMKERVVFYASKLIAEQIGAGDDYGGLHRSIIAVITYFDLTRDPSDYLHRFFLYDKKHDLIFTKLVEIDILEVKKLPKQEDGSLLWLWGKFFDAKTEEEFDMLAEKNEDVGKAVAIIKRLSGSERERRIAEIEEKRRRDIAAHEQALREEAVEEGMAEGMAKGMAEGMAKATEAIAVNLLRNGATPELVAKSTGLSVERILHLSEQNAAF